LYDQSQQCLLSPFLLLSLISDSPIFPWSMARAMDDLLGMSNKWRKILDCICPISSLHSLQVIPLL
jgi:hypothetical protein